MPPPPMGIFPNCMIARRAERRASFHRGFPGFLQRQASRFDFFYLNSCLMHQYFVLLELFSQALYLCL
jgi:hypothetical protein